MQPIKALAICGTRPDAVKMAPVVIELNKHKDEFETVLAVTGQHREMLAQVMEAFSLKPDYDLDIMTTRQTLAQITTRALEGLERIIEQVSPEIILAQGDTTTTFAASLAAFYHKIPFGHVEAGLRTENKYDPFPEEINRRLTGILADLHFAPTEKARENLRAEGVRDRDIFVTGNTVIDALLSIGKKDYEFADKKINEALAYEKMVLVTAHRRENWGGPMRDICDSIKRILEAHKDVSVVFPVHKNPVVRDVVYPELENEERVFLIEPPEYMPFVHLIKRAHIVLTDSGGVQEEAPSFGKPVLVLRKTTERPEGVEAGVSKLVGTSSETIYTEANKLLVDSDAYQQMARTANPYGDGKASEHIRTAIFTRFA